MDQDDTKQQSLFLSLPVDLVILLLREFLPTRSALALSLTCKSLWALARHHGGMSSETLRRNAPLLLLEKDLGQNHYFCQYCSTLHPFSSSETWQRGLNNDTHGCRRRGLVELAGSPIVISHHHVRLMMNRHFLGAPNGLPLENFQVELPSRSGPGRLNFTERWAARIFRGMLFLSVTRTLCEYDMTDEELQRAIDNSTHDICPHTSTAKQKELKRPIRALHHKASITPCQNVVESCTSCFTDIATTVEQRWNETKTRAFWYINITSYHLLGAGRSTWDEWWRAFADKEAIYSRFYNSEAYQEWWQDVLIDHGDFFLPSLEYFGIGQPYSPDGAVRQAWKDSEA